MRGRSTLIKPRLTDNHSPQILELVRKNAREYYRQPRAKCKTWSYYTPFPPVSSQLVIGGLEIYTSKAALSDQVNDRDFQAYHETVKRERLYSKDEDLVAYYFTAGFVARKDHAFPFGGTLISLTRFICNDKAAVLELLKDFVPFVRNEEPFVLTYAVFERKKNPKELLVFVRYQDAAGMKSHSNASRHDEVV